MKTAGYLATTASVTSTYTVANLTASNIKSGVTILGVTGTLTAKDLGGTKLKTITKSMSLPSGTWTDSGLTDAELRGLYSIQITNSNNTTYLGNGTYFAYNMTYDDT